MRSNQSQSFEPLLISLFFSALSLRLFGEDVTIGARDAASQMKSGAQTPAMVIDGDAAIPEANTGVKLSNVSEL